MIDLNPFDDLIVNEPRRREPAVAGLNEKPFQTLLAQFDRLTDGPVPRPPHRAGRAQLVTSAQPGFGKSHLISRLFRSLHTRATLIYVRPFQNPALAFHSLLASVIREMNFPDRVESVAVREADPTQLDALAFGIFAHLLADLLERTPEGERAGIDLRRDPVAAFGAGAETDPWSRWMRETFATHRPAYEERLTRHGVELHSPDWLQVLFAYAFSYPNRDVRQACLDWMAGQSLAAEQTALIGLRATEAIPAEATEEALNEISRLRLIDLSRLTSFHRPFVFCFDQTESYGHHPPLARRLGMVIATLVNDAANHLTLITSNQSPWQKTISPFFEDADLDRLANPFLTLDGLTRVQGEELIRLRLATAGAETMLPGMLQRTWLDGEFASDRDRRGTRQFLQRCKERWEELREHPPQPLRTLPELYEERRAGLLADPRRLLFDADALQWLVKQCAVGLPDLAIYTTDTGDFTIGWQTPERRILFGFEAGSNWRRWELLARHAGDRAAKTPPLKVLFFRGEEQPQIPGLDWTIADTIDAAKRDYLDLITFSRDDFAALQAGYDLHAEALGGDIPPHDAAAVLAFLHGQFAPWWTRLAGPVKGASAPVLTSDPTTPPGLADQVRQIVATQKFLSLDELLTHLPDANSEATKDDVLSACGYISSIRIHAHPQMTVLQWQAEIA